MNSKNNNSTTWGTTPEGRKHGRGQEFGSTADDERESTKSALRLTFHSLASQVHSHLDQFINVFWEKNKNYKIYETFSLRHFGTKMEERLTKLWEKKQRINTAKKSYRFLVVYKFRNFNFTPLKKFFQDSSEAENSSK